MSQDILEVKDLKVSYGAIHALQGISLTLEEGSIISLIGANGAGKSTLLNAITGVVPIEDGKVFFKGEDITHKKSHQILNLGIAHVPEGRKIFSELTVEENLTVGGYKLYGEDNQHLKELQEQNYELFPILAERRKQLGGTLSGGEQQMLAIARGLMSEPDVLLLDEPSLGLAPIVVERIFDFIEKINQMGKTIFLVEQNASLAMSISSYVYVLETGRIVKEDTPDILLEDDSVRKIYLGL